MALLAPAPAPLRLHTSRPTSAPVCHFWLQGRCNRNPCRFAHPPLPSTTAAHQVQAPSSHKPRRILRRPVFEAEGSVEEKPQLVTTVQATLIAHLAGHHPGSSITGATLPRSSATLFTAGQDGVLKGWDRATGVCTQHLSLGQPAKCLFNSYDDPNWLFVGLTTEVRVVNLAGNCLPVGSPVLSLTSLGDLLLAGLEQGSILVWRFDATSAAFVPAASLSPAQERLSAVLTLERASSASATSKRILSGYADGTLRVWDVGTGKCMDELQAHHGAITQILSCGLDGVLSASHADGKIALWRIHEDLRQTSCSIAESGHDHHLLELLSTHIVSDAGCTLRPLAICGLFDEDNTPMLFASYTNSTVRVMELPSFIERGILHTEKPIQAMETGPHNLLVMGSSDGGLTVWSWLNQKS